MQRETVSPVARADHGVGFEYIAALIGAKNTTRILSAFFEPRTGGEINDRRIDYITAWKILNASVESSGDESHRLIQDGVPVGNFELLMASMLQGDNLLDGLRRMAAGPRSCGPIFPLSCRSIQAIRTSASASRLRRRSPRRSIWRL